DRQLIVQREFLGHVTDEGLDLIGLFGDIMAGDAGAPFGRFEQAAEHANDRRFTRPVRAEKTEDRSFGHLETDVIDRGEMAEAPGQTVAFDHDRRGHKSIRTPGTRPSWNWGS